MSKAESPGMISDIIISRFEEDYNPTIVYDASCKAKEYLLNRETRRAMEIRFVTDPFHEDNHISCAKSFRSSLFRDMDTLNKEAAKQTTRVLRRISTSTLYMNPNMYMRSLTLFCAYQNYKIR